MTQSFTKPRISDDKPSIKRQTPSAPALRAKHAALATTVAPVTATKTVAVHYDPSPYTRLGCILLEVRTRQAELTGDILQRAFHAYQGKFPLATWVWRDELRRLKTLEKRGFVARQPGLPLQGGFESRWLPTEKPWWKPGDKPALVKLSKRQKEALQS